MSKWWVRDYCFLTCGKFHLVDKRFTRNLTDCQEVVTWMEYNSTAFGISVNLTLWWSIGERRAHCGISRLNLAWDCRTFTLYPHRIFVSVINIPSRSIHTLGKVLYFTILDSWITYRSHKRPIQCVWELFCWQRDVQVVRVRRNYRHKCMSHGDGHSVSAPKIFAI